MVQSASESWQRFFLFCSVYYIAFYQCILIKRNVIHWQVNTVVCLMYCVGEFVFSLFIQVFYLICAFYRSCIELAADTLKVLSGDQNIMIPKFNGF